MDGWRSVSQKTSHDMAIKRIEMPRMVARGVGGCDDRISVALWDWAIIACGCGAKGAPWHWPSESQRPARTERPVPQNVVKFASVPVRYDHIARFIENANQSIMRAALRLCGARLHC
jgi:hypothetical protein